VVGLGNPGPGYAANRHNVGAMVVGELAGRAGGKFKRHRSNTMLTQGRLAGRPVALATPLTLMNVSGGPVSSAAKFFKVPAASVVVVHDDLDLPFEEVRLKAGGGSGGHNGLRSIDRSLGTPDYLRVRLGIGRPPGRMDPAAFVLRDFSPAERKELPLLLDRAADATEMLLREGLAAAQNRFHSAV
jgi:PTH1 family peptidyl-tRNA hydrolase